MWFWIQFARFYWDLAVCLLLDQRSMDARSRNHNLYCLRLPLNMLAAGSNDRDKPSSNVRWSQQLMKAGGGLEMNSIYD